MSRLAEKTISVLSSAGWSSYRSRDISEFAVFLEGRGFAMFPAAKTVLSMFGGLEFSFFINDRAESFHFSPQLALGDGYEHEDFDEVEERIGESLVVIGEARRRNMIMFVSESGRIFAMTGYYISKFGDDIYEALDMLCLPRPSTDVQ